MCRRWTALAFALAPLAAAALQCPPMPQQASRDTEVEVKVGVRMLGDAKGPELETRTRQLTTDLLGKVPRADRVYLEQMLFAAYCSAVRDNAALTEAEREARVAAYGREMRRTLAAPAPTAPKEDPRDKARAELARLPLPYTPEAFFAAIRRGDQRVVELFLAAGIDRTKADRDGESPLSLSILHGQREITKALLAAGTPPDGWSITRTIYRNELDVTRELLARRPGADDVANAFANAVAAGHLAAAKLLAAHGADVAALAPLVLRRASRSMADDAQIAETLAWVHGQGVALDTPDEEGWTLLMRAAANGRPQVLRATLKAGGDANRRCACPGYLEGGLTPLLMAAIRGEREPLELLLDARADPAALTARRRTALHVVAEDGSRDERIPQLLIERGVPLDTVDDDGQTPLMWMVVRDLAAARELIARGARPDARTPDGRTPLTFAAAGDAAAAIKLLLDAGVAIDARTETGRTALAIAVRNGALDAARALLQRGARTDLADRDGLKPLDHALALANTESKAAIVRLLQNAGARP